MCSTLCAFTRCRVSCIIHVASQGRTSRLSIGSSFLTDSYWYLCYRTLAFSRKSRIVMRKHPWDALPICGGKMRESGPNNREQAFGSGFKARGNFIQTGEGSYIPKRLMSESSNSRRYVQPCHVCRPFRIQEWRYVTKRSPEAAYGSDGFR